MEGFETLRAFFREPSDVGGDHLGGMHSLYIRNIHGKELLLGIAAHPAIRLVHLKDSSLHVGPKEAVHGRLERDPVAFFAFMQRLTKKNVFIHFHRFILVPFVTKTCP
jgi:hypothetical protein